MPEKCTVAPNLDCPNATKMALLETRVEHLEDGQEREEKFRKAYYEERESRIERDTKLNVKIDNMDKKLDEVVIYQREQQNKPNKLIDKLKEEAWKYVLVLLLAYLAVRLGLRT